MARRAGKMAKSVKHTHNRVIGFGFLNGLWLAVGVNPEAIVEKAIKPYLDPLVAALPPLARMLFIALPSLITILTLLMIYKKGGLQGGVAVLLGFLGGFFIISFPITAILLVVTGYAIGVRGFRS